MRRRTGNKQDISIFVQKKLKFRTCFVYFYTLAYEFKVPTKSHRVWATCASTSKKKEERKYWQMSINSAYRVNAFF